MNHLGDTNKMVDTPRINAVFTGMPECQHCGYYARVEIRTSLQGWHVAQWGECRKADLTKTGAMTLENQNCADFTPDPRRWHKAKEDKP